MQNLNTLLINNVKLFIIRTDDEVQQKKKNEDKYNGESLESRTKKFKEMLLERKVCNLFYNFKIKYCLRFKYKHYQKTNINKAKFSKKQIGSTLFLVKC